LDFLRRYILGIALVAQAGLLGARLDLLPLWDDERYTLQTAAKPPGQIVAAVRVDVHPPLYYWLMHAWLKLPLPGSALERARALSALLALGATLVFDRLWLRGLAWERRALFLGLWVSSPCLVLYARMARSYTLQLLLAVVAIRAARDWLQAPANRAAMGCYIAAAAVLLYAHYLPGLAVVLSTAALGLWRRQWRHLAAVALIALLYLPWLGAFLASTRLVAEHRPYWLAANVAAENLLKLSYVLVAFCYGETPPAWALAAGAALLPVLGWTLWKAWRSAARPPMLFVLVAAAGYFVASSWVSFAFVGARLLFLLPFFYLFLVGGLDARRWHGALTYAALLAIACGGLASYYRRQDFLNKGYLVDFEQIARHVEEQSRERTALVLLDRDLSSAGYYLHGLRIPHPEILHGDRASAGRALDRLRAERPQVGWYLRYSRDLTPGRIHGLLDGELARDWAISRHGFVAYSALDRAALGWLGLAGPPSHVVELLELRR